MKAPFKDRTAAGRELAALLGAYRDRTDVLVLGLPRGGVPVAHEVARTLGAPLDVLIVRKLGAPGQPEFALGAVASGGVILINEGALAWFRDSERLDKQASAERAEVERREHAYRGARAPLNLQQRTVILVDDGAATGASMRAAVRAARQLGARKVVVALPVSAREALALLREEADDVVCVNAPPAFAAVGFWYQNFNQTSDDEVRALLGQAAASAPTPHAAG